MVLAKYLQENLVDDFETDGQTDYRTDPKTVEVKPVACVLMDGKQNREVHQLKNNVGEEDWELAVELAPNHGRRQDELQGGVGNPEHELDLGIHGV